MAALGCYASANRYIMTSSETGEAYIESLQKFLPPLRFYLACRVCNMLLSHAMSPDHTECQHTVCKSCVGGKMKLKPLCGWCQGYENFKPNAETDMLIKCYQLLCRYVLSSVHYKSQRLALEANSHNGAGTISDNIHSLLTEGRDFQVRQDAGYHIDSLETMAKPPKPFHETSQNRLPGRPKKRSHSISSPNNKAVRNGDTPLTKKLKKSKGAMVSEVRLEPLVTASRASTSLVEEPDNPANLTHDYCNEVPGPEKEEPTRLKSPRKEKAKLERKGCGCGTATANPGKLTCYGQRCPCYANHNPCMDCRCRGCRNPNKVVRIQQTNEDTDNEIIVE